jgi:hypothetical protein
MLASATSSAPPAHLSGLLLIMARPMLELEVGAACCWAASKIFILVEGLTGPESKNSLHKVQILSWNLRNYVGKESICKDHSLVLRILILLMCFNILSKKETQSVCSLN